MGTKRILLVEDDPISLKLMRGVLQANGYETEEVTNGPDALARASQSALDLIVMDIGLPGLDGVETARWLRNAPATLAIPIVAVTAYAMPGDEERIRSAGCDAYLTKPLRFAEFMTLVHTLLAAPAGNDG
jgi:two-component system, cell cycle response regulator DivK